MNRFVPAPLLLAALPFLLCSGCYSTRTRLPEYATSIAVPMFGNKSHHDQYTRELEVQVTEATRKAFLRNGKLRLDERQSAVLILTGDVMRLERTPLRVDRFGEPAETKIRILARISLYDVKAAKYLFDKRMISNDSGRAESGVYDLRRGENEALGQQRALDDLGANIAHAVLDVW